MALTPCPHCGNYISDKAKRCPKCGAELSEEDFNKNVNFQREEETPLEFFYYDEAPQPRNRRWMWIVFPVIFILIMVGSFLYFTNEKKNAEAVRAAVEQARQDSLMTAQQEAQRMEKLRQDSIMFEDAHRLTANIWFSKGTPRVNKNWKTKILELGFEEGQPVNTGNMNGDYDDELYETRYIPYTRTFNGRKIEIRENQERLIRSSDGEYLNGGSWGQKSFYTSLIINILFEDKNDYEEFKNSLVQMGMKYKKAEKSYGFWDKFDPLKGYRHNGETLIKFKEKNQYEVEMVERYYEC